MTARCDSPVSTEKLVDYLGDDLGRAEMEAIEEHLFGCDVCEAEAERLAGVVAALAQWVPPVLSASRFDALANEGRVGETNAMGPGETATVVYPHEGQLLVHRLRGVDLSGAERVDLRLGTLDGRTLTSLEDVPFDPSQGEVLVACQRHFAETFPHDMIFALDVIDGERRREVARYTVVHVLEATR